MDHVYSKDDEIADTSMQRPHLIILGSGASVAAFPNGERNGVKLPVMKNFVSTLNLRELLDNAGINYEQENFEVVYSIIHANSKMDNTREEIEQRVRAYFQQMALPDTPTIYDYLVLSLRPKDVIATFNWDPFLWEACRRNHAFLDGKLPIILFLHGCCVTGYCDRHKPVYLSRDGGVCLRCHAPLKTTPLLFPVADKDYISNEPIAAAWRCVRGALESAFVFTIFGYGSPETDAAAVDLIGKAWGNSAARVMEEIEIIDSPSAIAEEEQLRTRWDRFIHSHHYQVHADYFRSLLATHPRRTVEAMWAQLLDAKVVEGNPVPPLDKFSAIAELQEWFSPLIKAE